MLEQVAALENRLQQSFQFRLSQLPQSGPDADLPTVCLPQLAEGSVTTVQRLDELSFRLESRLGSHLGELKGRERLLAADLGHFRPAEDVATQAGNRGQPVLPAASSFPAISFNRPAARCRR
jgi:hypothetical protein